MKIINKIQSINLMGTALKGVHQELEFDNVEQYVAYMSEQRTNITHLTESFKNDIPEMIKKIADAVEGTDFPVDMFTSEFQEPNIDLREVTKPGLKLVEDDEEEDDFDKPGLSGQRPEEKSIPGFRLLQTSEEVGLPDIDVDLDDEKVDEESILFSKIFGNSSNEDNYSEDSDENDEYDPF